MSKEEQVTISKRRLRDLEDAETLLSCLESAGVDNWEGYGGAYSEYLDILKEEQENA